MSKTTRLAYYFRALPAGTLVSHQEIIDLLWRGCPEGGPMNPLSNIGQYVLKIRRAPDKYNFQGFTIVAHNNGNTHGNSAGYRMEKADGMR